MLKYLVFLLPVIAQGASVVSCHDGDTCRVKDKGAVFKVRLSGIDAPEKGQDGYVESKKLLTTLVAGKEIQLKCEGSSYDRKTCEIFVGGVDVQEQMVKAGWAFDYPRHSMGKYKKAQEEAKKGKLGVWSFSKIVSPHCFRSGGARDCKFNSVFQP